MQISEQLFQAINNNNKPKPVYTPIFSLRGGSLKDDLLEIDTYEKNRVNNILKYKNIQEEINLKRKEEAVIKKRQQFEIKKDIIVSLKKENLQAEIKKENTHFMEEIELLDRIKNLTIRYSSIKIKNVLLCQSVMDRLAPGDQTDMNYFTTNFKLLELDEAVPKKFEYKNIIFIFDKNISNEEVFRFEFDE